MVVRDVVRTEAERELARALVEEVAAEQWRRDWTDEQMGRVLNISRANWNHVRNGRQFPSRNLLLEILFQFPRIWFRVVHPEAFPAPAFALHEEPT